MEFPQRPAPIEPITPVIVVEPVEEDFPAAREAPLEPQIIANPNEENKDAHQKNDSSSVMRSSIPAPHDEEAKDE